MGCKVTNIKASNGQPSILWKDLEANLKDQVEAFSLWIASKSDKYSKLYEDPTNLDENGELLYDVVVSEVQKGEEAAPAVTKLKKAVDDITVMLARQITTYKSRITKEEAKDKTERQKQLIRRLEVLLERVQKNVDDSKQIEALVLFVEEASKQTERARRTMEKLSTKKRGVTTPNDVKSVFDTYNYIRSFDVLDNISTEVIEAIEGSNSTFGDVWKKTRSNKEAIEEAYYDMAIPILADWLLDYSPSTINDSVMEFISSIANNPGKGRSLVLTMPRIRKSADFKRLNKKFKDKEISEAEYTRQVDEMVIQHIMSKNLLSRDTLIGLLKASSKDKSAFSMWLDPLIYSSDSAISLFAKAVKANLYKADEATRAKQFEMKDWYDEYKKTVNASPDNVAKFNDAIIEDIEVWDKDEKRMIKQLSFVQPLDIEKYFKDKRENTLKIEKEVKEQLSKKYKEDVDKSRKKFDSYQDWIENTKIGKEYEKLRWQGISKWITANTEEVAGAQEKFNEKIKEKNALNKKKNELSKELESLESKLKDNKITEAQYRKSSEELSLSIEATELSISDVDNWLGKNTYVPWGTDLVMFRGELRQPKKKLYSNPKYEQLLKNENAKKYYDRLLGQYKEDQKRLPQNKLRTNPWEDFTYWLPTIEKETNDVFIENNPLAATKEILQRNTKVTATDTENGILDQSGEEARVIPIFYVNPEESSRISKDVISSILRFHHMTNQFVAKKDIHAEVEMMRDVISNRETATTNSEGQTKYDAIAKKVGIKRFINKYGDDRNLRHINEFIDMVYYGKSNVKQLVGNVDLNKVSSSLSFWTALNGLSFNLLQGVNNVVLGNVLSRIEAFGGQFYTPKNWRKAHKLFFSEGAGLKDIGKFHASSKLGQLVEMFDPLQGEFSSAVGKGITGSQAKKAFTQDAFFVIQHGGEYHMQVTTMLALMDNFKVRNKEGKLINKEGKIVENEKDAMTLWEAFKKNANGQLELDKNVANFNLNSFRDLVHGINGKLHGKFNTFDQAILKRYWWGKLAMLFRTWVVPGLRRRFGHGDGLQTDVEVGQLTEGNYITFYRLLRSGLKNIKSNWGTMTLMEKSNVRKTLGEAIALLSAVILVKALSSLDLGEDDEELWFILYQARRLQSEIAFYTPAVGLTETWRILKSPTATMSTVSKTIRLVDQAMFNPLEVYDRDSGFNKKGDLKVWARTRALIPILNNLEKAANAQESYSWFDRAFAF